MTMTMQTSPTTAPNTSPQTAPAAAGPARPRFLSEADCKDIGQRLARYRKGTGVSMAMATIISHWRGNVR